MREIKASDYICKKIPLNEELQKIYLSETRVIHYLILDIDNDTLEVIAFNGTPMFDKVVHTIDDVVSAGYTLNEIPSTEITITSTHKNLIQNNLNVQDYQGELFQWHGKQLLIPKSQFFYSGNGQWLQYPD